MNKNGCIWLILIGFMMFSSTLFSYQVIPKQELILEVVQDQLVFDRTTIKQATVLFGRGGDYKGLRIILKPDAKEALKQITKAGLRKKANIVLNDKIALSMMVLSELRGDILITGLTRFEAEQFVTYLAKG